jgi:titin
VWKGESEGFVFVLNANGSAPVYSSFHGGERADVVNSVVLDDVDNWVVAGGTESRDIPLTDDAYQGRVSGDADSFVSIIGEHLPTSAPLELNATGGEAYIELEWKRPLEDNGYPVRRYLLLRGTSEDDLRFYRALDPVQVYVDTEVEWGVYYHYAVQASNGKGRSPLSNPDSARSVTVPDGPLNLTGEAMMDSVLLQWEHPAFTGGLPLSGFIVYRTAEGDPLELATPLPAGATSFEDALVDDGVNYTYAVTALNGYGESRQLVMVTLRTHAVPSPPVGLDHTYGDTFVNLTWDPPLADNGLPVTGYAVLRSEEGGSEERVGTVTAPAVSFVDTDVSVGVLYTYAVRAENAKGLSGSSKGLDAVVMVAPDPPQEAQAVAARDFVKVTWSAPSFDGASPVLGYRVYLGEHPGDAICLGGPSAFGPATTVLAFLHDVPYDGVVRRYFVTAVNAEGESGPSPVTATLVYRPPDPPGDLVVAWGDGSTEVAWSPPVSDGGAVVELYTLYRMVEGEDDFAPIAQLEEGQQSFIDTGLANGLEHEYRVSATNLAGESRPSELGTAVPAGPPGAPVDLAAEPLPGSVRLAWGPPVDDGGHPVSTYVVLRMTDGGRMETLAELDGPVLEWVDDGVENGVAYTYAVAAVTDAGESPKSAVARAVPYGTPGAPLGFAAHWVDGRVQLTWSAPLEDGGRSISGYRLRRSDGNGTDRWELSPMAVTTLDDGVVAGLTYTYTIHAYNAAGEGEGTEVSITVPLPEPGPPESSSVSIWPFLMVAVVLLAAALLLFVGRRRGGVPGQALL